MRRLVRELAGELTGSGSLRRLMLAMVSLRLAAAAAVGTWLPARRAPRIDPLVALRQD